MKELLIGLGMKGYPQKDFAVIKPVAPGPTTAALMDKCSAVGDAAPNTGLGKAQDGKDFEESL